MSEIDRDITDPAMFGEPHMDMDFNRWNIGKIYIQNEMTYVLEAKEGPLEIIWDFRFGSARVKQTVLWSVRLRRLLESDNQTAHHR